MNDGRVWFITGASSGFGRALAEAAVGRGDRVAAAARDISRVADLAAGDRVGLQPGDPTKAAQAILAALDAEDPPLRLVLGADAIANVRARTGELKSELDHWEEVGRRTAIDGA